MYKQQCGGGWVNKISQCLASHGPLNTSIMIVAIVILSTKLTSVTNVWVAMVRVDYLITRELEQMRDESAALSRPAPDIPTRT